MRAKIITQRAWTISALEVGSGCPAEEYIRSLQPGDRKRVMALLKFAAEKGPPKNREKFNKVEGQIFEFKSFQDRLPCFYQPNRVIVLTHGFRKKRDRMPTGQLARAQRLHDDFIRG